MSYQPQPMESLLNVVENTKGDCKKADVVESHVIEELSVRLQWNPINH